MLSHGILQLCCWDRQVTYEPNNLMEDPLRVCILVHVCPCSIMFVPVLLRVILSQFTQCCVKIGSDCGPVFRFD